MIINLLGKVIIYQKTFSSLVYNLFRYGQLLRYSVVDTNQGAPSVYAGIYSRRPLYRPNPLLFVGTRKCTSQVESKIGFPACSKFLNGEILSYREPKEIFHIKRTPPS